MEARDGQQEPHYEVVGLNLWRRFILGGEGPELTLSEAAAALGLSEGAVRGLVEDGRIRARRGPGGDLRIVPVARSLTGHGIETAAGEEEIRRLWDDLKAVRIQLAEATTERDEFRFRAARMAEEIKDLQRQLDELWQMLKDAKPSRQTEQSPAEPPSRLLSAGANDPAARERVKDVVVDYRELFRRRRRGIWTG